MPNYLPIAWRQARKHPVYSAIHVLGLAIGICACTVIWLIARYDLGFDRFHPDVDRIYRIVGDVRLPEGNSLFLNCPPEQGALEHAIPGFSAQAIFHTFGATVTIPAEKGQAEKDFSAASERYHGTSMILTGPSFFSLFPHRWLLGSPAVLDAPDRLVLAESAARKYLGTGPLEAMMGKTIVVDDSLPLVVAGIVADWDKLSDLDYTGFISLSTAPATWVRSRFATADWSSLHPHQSQAFVKLAPGVTPARVNAALARYVRETHAHFFPGTSDMRLYLQPLRDMHYTADFRPVDTGDDFPKAYLPMLYALMVVAVFILVLAVINFINLSTARSIRRVREVGIRKVMGSSRGGLTGQFLVETFLLSGGAVVVSSLLVVPALQLFAQYIPHGVRFRVFDTGNLLFLLGIAVLTTVCAGYYPARVLSGYLPVLSLRGVLGTAGSVRGGGGGRLRKALIVFQFTLSLLFIIGSLVVGRQVRFMRDADKGFNSDAVVTVAGRRVRPEQMQLFAARVRQLAGVRDVILEGNSPMGSFHRFGAKWIYAGKRVAGLSAMDQAGGGDFIPFYQMRLLAGRNLFPGDSAGEGVINETFVHAMGLAQSADAVGQILYLDSIKPFRVVGVVADFHENAFHETIKPLIIRHEPAAETMLAVKLATTGGKGEEAKAALAGIAAEWKSLFAKRPFTYSFLNESISRLYDVENNTAWLMEVAMGITIVISCMGLFGLALFTAERRTKEVGIRKVLGATVAQVTLLLSRDFVLLVVLALLIASPVAWFFAGRWLEGFAYRLPMSIWVLVEAGLAAIGLALLTVGWQAVRAARGNPVQALRSE